MRRSAEEERIEAAEFISESAAEKAGEAATELRWHDFTDVSGQFQVTAQLAGFASGTATLRKEDGSEVKVSVDRLSEADQQWIRDEIRQRSR